MESKNDSYQISKRNQIHPRKKPHISQTKFRLLVTIRSFKHSQIMEQIGKLLKVLFKLTVKLLRNGFFISRRYSDGRQDCSAGPSV